MGRHPNSHNYSFGGIPGENRGPVKTFTHLSLRSTPSFPRIMGADPFSFLIKTCKPQPRPRKPKKNLVSRPAPISNVDETYTSHNQNTWNPKHRHSGCKLGIFFCWWPDLLTGAIWSFGAHMPNLTLVVSPARSQHRSRIYRAPTKIDIYFWIMEEDYNSAKDSANSPSKTSSNQ